MSKVTEQEALETIGKLVREVQELRKAHGMAAVRHYSDECDQLRARIKVLEDRAKVDAERRSRDEADLKELRGFARGILDHSFSPEPFRLAVYWGLLTEPFNPTRILTGDDPQIVANDDDTSNST